MSQTATSKLTQEMNSLDQMMENMQQEHENALSDLRFKRQGLAHALEVLNPKPVTVSRVKNRRLAAEATVETTTKPSSARREFFLEQVRAGNSTLKSMEKDALNSGLFTSVKDFHSRSTPYLNTLVKRGLVEKNTEGKKNTYLPLVVEN